MLGKKVNVTGWDDIFIEAGLTTFGPVQGLMNGKNYSNSMVCHRTMLGDVERLLKSEFPMKKRKSNQMRSHAEENLMRELTETPRCETLEAVSSNDSI